jgi:6-pyruvoyltetrahydropterin/6-carboxytetrahydropterin synthase
MPPGLRCAPETPVAEPVVRITTSAHFSAAHRLHNEARDAAWNRAVFGKCNNPFGHGHTYGLEVTVEGPVDPERGWVLDFADLRRIVAEKVVRRCDLKNLNTDVPFLAGINPTAENIAVRIWEELGPEFAPARLVRIVLHETERNRVVYTGPES